MQNNQFATKSHVKLRITSKFTINANPSIVVLEFLVRVVFLGGEEDVGYAQRPVCNKGLAIVAHFLWLVCNYTLLSLSLYQFY